MTSSNGVPVLPTCANTQCQNQAVIRQPKVHRWFQAKRPRFSPRPNTQEKGPKCRRIDIGYCVRSMSVCTRAASALPFVVWLAEHMDCDCGVSAWVSHMLLLCVFAVARRYSVDGLLCPVLAGTTVSWLAMMACMNSSVCPPAGQDPMMKRPLCTRPSNPAVTQPAKKNQQNSQCHWTPHKNSIQRMGFRAGTQQ